MSQLNGASEATRASVSSQPLHFTDIGQRKARLPEEDCPPAWAQQRAFARAIGQKQTLVVHALLALTSILGTLARVGLQSTSMFGGQQVVFPLLWVQGLGCALMGLLVKKRDELEEIYAPLYVALTIGFCGSMTSFSGFMSEVFDQFANLSGTQSRWHSFLGGLYISLTTLAVIVSAVQLGVHVADALPTFGRKRLPTREPFPASRNDPSTLEIDGGSRDDFSIPVQSRPKGNFWLDQVVIVIGSGAWVASAVVCGLVPAWRGKITFAMVLSPVGTIMRLWISRWINSRQSQTRFPLGTMIANLASTAMFGMAYLLQRTLVAQDNVDACGALQGVQDGFSGCLSTISTMIIEILSLPRLNAYLYFISTWTLGQVLLLLIIGIYSFTQGLAPACSYNVP